MGGYLGMKSSEMMLRRRNVGAYTNQGGQFAAGYDISYADVRGRFVYATATYTFK